MSGIKAVLFDVGGVLVGLDFPGMFRRLVEQSDADADTIQGLFWPERGPNGESSDTPLARATAGRISAPELLDLLHREMKFRGEKSELERTYHSLFTGRIEGTLEIMKRLHGKVHVGIVSNSNALCWPGVEDLLPELEQAELFTSYDVQLVKPDPKLWEHLLRHYSLSASEIVFIDDTKDIIERAREFGIDGLHFTNPEKLDADLRERGL